MNDTADEHQNLVLGIVFALIAAVVAGSIVLAASRLFKQAPAAPTPTAMAAAPGVAPTAAAMAVEAPAALGAALDKLYFEVGTADLPANANEVLGKVADAARSGTQIVLISGFHDASGDPAKNAELAKNRAMAVRHALEANGVAPERLIMSKPAVTTGGDDPREARRVELRLQ